jgi:hypothetical protein
VAWAPPNKELKLTKPEHNGASQLNSSVIRTCLRQQRSEREVTSPVRIGIAAVAALAIVAGAGFWSMVVWGATGAEVAHARYAVQAVMAAQVKYAAANHGLYAPRIDCLSRPAACGVSVAKSPLPASVDMVLEHVSDHEYVPVETGPGVISGYVYLAAPARRAPWWARYTLVALPLAFCGDHTGRVCALPASYRLPAGAKACPPGCSG